MLLTNPKTKKPSKKKGLKVVPLGILYITVIESCVE